MTINGPKQRVIKVSSYLVTFHVLLAYGLFGGTLVFLAVGAGVLYYRIQAVATVAITLSLVVATLFYGLVLKVTGLDNSVYYRPDEILSEYREDLGHRAYRRDETIHMRVPYGDLQPMTNTKVGLPHDVEYRIDHYGFRNDADYAGESYLLVGDSFVAGTSNTQTDILSAQLKRDYGIASYNLAHPGGLPDYANYVEAFAHSHRDFKVLVFAFEGNDFILEKEGRHSTLSYLLKRYSDIFSNTSVYRVTNSLIKRATRRSQISGEAYVTIRDIHGSHVALHTRYIHATKTKGLPENPKFEDALTRLKPYHTHIFFIPTNYRVYYKVLEGAQAPTLANANWEYLSGLCAREGLDCTNLTGPMIRAAESSMAKGELLWWPDDSHWNRNGIAVAARVVAKTLKRDDRDLGKGTKK